MKKKIILYLGGGCMSGIFGAGVVTKFQEMKFYNKIEAIYAGSVGAMNAAYFLARQTKLGSSIYYEDLTTNFIKPFNVPIGILQLFWNRYIYQLSEERINNIVSIDYVFEIIRNKKVLDIKKLNNQNINFYVKLLNVFNGEIEYINVKKHNSLNILKAAISIVPYCFNSEKINGKAYIDGTIKEPIGLKHLLKKHPNQKIIVVINEPIDRGFRHYSKVFLEGSVAKLHPYNIPLFKFFINREKSVRNDIRMALSNERVLLIHPLKNNPTVPRTTKYSKLMTTYKMGIKEAEKIKYFID